MKVVHIVGGDLGRGAHRGAFWQHKGLLEIGVDSTIIGPIPLSQESDRVRSTSQPGFAKMKDTLIYRSNSLLLRLYSKRTSHIFSTGLFGRKITHYPQVREADIVNIHWVSRGPISVRAIGALHKLGKPIVWTIRDMWPFTGGCHYSLDCSRYMQGCGACPQLGSHRNLDLSRLVYKYKSTMLSPKIQIVGISEWISDCARKSALFREFDVRTIPNCIDTSRFRPIGKSEARASLGIKPDRKVVLLGAGDIANFYKGFESFLDAIKLVKHRKIFVLLFGNRNPERMADIPCQSKELGFLDDEKLRVAYCAADVFVAPSRQEAFGKTLVEAMSCGTPVVCFDSSGPKDIVIHKETGFKAKPFLACDLALGIDWVLSNSENKKLSRESSKRALEVFDKKIIASRYASLYDELVRD